MTLLKRFSRSAIGRRLIVAVGMGYIRLVHATSRWSAVGAEIPAALWDARKPFILCFWHNRLLLMPYVWNYERRIVMLSSHHPDGQLIARVVQSVGVETILGSSSKGGTAALRAMLAALKEGASVGITPDGPRGPRMRASAGVIQIARLSGVPIVPVAISTERRRVLRSWDRFQVPLPFTRGVFVWGQPIEVAAKGSPDEMEAARLAVEVELNRISSDADRRVGQVPIEPADIPGKPA